MSADTNTGGPAFPSPALQTFKEGMTLRDYFAAKAMQGLMGRAWGDMDADKLFRTWANSAYKMADAMLKARHS
jgi:hypothetical protein